MAQDERDDSLNPSTRANYQPAPEPLRTPTFDEESVHRARPAVPLRGRLAKTSQAIPAMLLLLVAGIAGGLIALFAITTFQRRSIRTPAENSQIAPAAQQRQDMTSNGGASPNESRQAITPAPAAGPVQPIDGGQKSGPRGDEAADAAAQSLRGALDAWIAATNARDVDRQMDFYGSQVSTFYRSRNVSRRDVRAEKAQLFSRTDAVDVRAGEPAITFGRDGKTATMRFRKQYAISGGGRERRGEVVQELRWRQTPDGWKIVGERDLRVIR